MKDFFDGLMSLGFFQWVGLILLAETIRGGSLFSFSFRRKQ